MACASSCASRENVNGSRVPLITDDVTFEELQRRRMSEMESRMKEDIKRKRHEWEKDLDKMRKEFLKLMPVGKEDAVDAEELDERRNAACRCTSNDTMVDTMSNGTRLEPESRMSFQW